ncbi:hypothetical protein GCK32_016769, partial [Trichostrongylus colubriformis]
MEVTSSIYGPGLATSSDRRIGIPSGLSKGRKIVELYLSHPIAHLYTYTKKRTFVTSTSMLTVFLGWYLVALAKANYEDLKTSVRQLNNELDKAQLSRATELRFSSLDMVDRTVRAGSSIELKCEVYSVPPPVFTWKLNGKLIVGVEDANLVEKLSNVG